MSCSMIEEENSLQRKVACTLLRRHSISNPRDFTAQQLEDTVYEVIDKDKGCHSRTAVDTMNDNYTYSNHLRKGSSGLDSGVDFGSIDGSSGISDN